MNLTEKKDEKLMLKKEISNNKVIRFFQSTYNFFNPDAFSDNRVKKMIKLCHGDEDKVISRFEDKVLLAKEPNLSFWFVNSVKKADLEKHADVVLNNGTAYDIYSFSSLYRWRKIQDLGLENDDYVDLSRFENKVLELKDPKVSIDYIEDKKTNDYVAHWQVIYENGTTEQKAHIIAEIMSNEDKYGIKFNVAAVKEFIQLVIDEKCVEAACAFLNRGVKDVQIRHDLLRVVALGEVDTLYFDNLYYYSSEEDKLFLDSILSEDNKKEINSFVKSNEDYAVKIRKKVR